MVKTAAPAFVRWLATTIRLAAATCGRGAHPDTIGAGWMLFMHYVDIYWLVMPTAHHGEFHPNLVLDITCWLGIGGIFFAVLVHLMQRGSLIPVRDPRLAESLAFENP